MTKRLSALFLAFLLCVSSLITLSVSAATTSYSTEKNYNDVYDGIVDSASTATLEDVTSGFLFWKTYDYTKITPNPSASPNTPVKIDHYDLNSSLNLSLGRLKYISIYCRYSGSKTLEKPVLTIMGQNGKSMTKSVTVTALNSIPQGSSSGWVNFEVGTAIYGNVIGESLAQFHLLPYGNMRSGDLTSSDVVIIESVKFRSYDKASEVAGASYPIRFTGGREDVTGTDPATTYVVEGGEITLPANPYSRPNHTFNGWLCSANNQVYQPGDKYTVYERTRVGSDFYGSTTGEAIFFPDWKIVDDTVEYPNDFSTYYSDYYNGMLGNKDYFTATKDYYFQGKKTVQLKIKTTSSDALILDGWTWENMPFDLDNYNYVTITYYLDTTKTISATPYINFLSNTSSPSTSALTSHVAVSSDAKLQTGKWATIGFDLTNVKAKLNPDLEKHNLRQFHLYFTGHQTSQSNRIKASDFNDGDALYMYCLTLHKTKPADIQNPGNSLEYNTDGAAKYIQELDAYEAQRISQIRNTASITPTGTVYYVSSSSGSSNGGSSSSSPKLISTLSEVSGMSLKSGDTVLFKRGDVFRGSMTTIAGVTYSAYGSGAKPKLIRSEKNHVGSDNWVLYHEDSTGKKIWKTAANVTNDVGAIILNEGEEIAIKEIPTYTNGAYYVRGQENTTLFEVTTHLDNDLEFFHDLGGEINTAGPVYFRCDSGNPGSVYYSIEMNQRGNLISAKDGVTIDNLCLLYFGSHGIGAGTVANLTVTNCELGYGGGSIQYYNESNSYRVVRFGNGVEIYGGLVNFTIDNCYVYEIYDAGITHQISKTSAGNYHMKNVVYTNNVLCDSTYNIEYFMSDDNASITSERFMEDVLFEGNLIRRAGYGWGQQRPDDAPAGIKGWAHSNYAVNTVIRNNIIDRCYNHTGGKSHLIQLGTKYNGSTAYLDSNTFVQVPGRDFALSHNKDYKYDFGVTDYISFIGGKNNNIYYAPEDYGISEKVTVPVSGITYSNVHKGVVDRANTATVTDSSTDITVITPNPKGSPDSVIALDHYSLESLDINLPNLKYISIYCKYEGTKTLPKPTVTVMAHGGKYLTKNVTASSNESIPKNKYGWVSFDVGEAAYGTVTGDKLGQFHLKPYGETRSGDLTASDIIDIQMIRFVYYDETEESGIIGVYPIKFMAGRPDVSGKDPETVYLRVGGNFTLPQNPYTRPNYTFNGWLCSADNQVYQPGALYTMTERTRVGSAYLRNTTGEAIFYPDWKIVNSDVTLPETLSVDYTDYYGGMLGSKDYFTSTANFNFMGRRTRKLELKPASSDALMLDGWSWDTMPFDLDKYCYATITYYFDTDTDLSGATPQAIFYSNSGTYPTALSATVTVNADNQLQTNQWAVIGFDLSALKAKLNTSTSKHYLRQFHLLMTGHKTENADRIKASDFSEGDVLYMDTLTLYSEKPENIQIVPGIVAGDGNGNVRPHDVLTRAEAAQLILNTLGRAKPTEILAKLPSYDQFENNFSDVASTDWFYYAVMVMDTLGYLPEDGEFRPYDPITVSEFMRIMFFIEKDNMNGMSSFMSDTGNSAPITRAQAVVLLNEWIAEGTPEKLLNSRVKVYDDLDTNAPEYYAFLNIGAARLSSFDEDGNETIYQLLCPGSSSDSLLYDTKDGDSYIKELNTMEAERIEEIRNTKSQYTTKSFGKVYYVSSSEGTTSGGSSPENPRLITKLSEVANLGAANGDVVLFKRGDLFRGQMSAVAGVTYSAYGEGPKPMFYRSEKNHSGAGNWELYHEDTTTGVKVWKTTYTVTNDVGAIMINDGEIVGLKEIPSYLSGVYYVRGKESETKFDMITEFDRNYEFFHNVNGAVTGSGYVYFRCDEGNPGELFESIEMNQRGNLISAKNNNTFDNLCLKYFGSHGIGAGTTSNLTVTNCEIGWGGGSMQHFNTTGTVTRYGNGVEIYGGLVNFTIDNCYVYEIYDAGITHQISKTSHGNYYMENVVYSNNVLCDSTYNIEYFMSNDENSETSERFMENVLFEGNLLRRAGYGWGQQRPDNLPASVKGWTHNNYAINTTLKNNIIDRCYNYLGKESYLIQLGTKYNGSTAYLDGNIFVQVPGRYFALNHRTGYEYNHNTNDYIGFIGGKNNTVYYSSEDYGTRR
ncbi:MAG: S-layer homology domain-containing protein [Clostridia bacterium]|nr:S-layer homology domain-containing protein [Clostridia bacterium]